MVVTTTSEIHSSNTFVVVAVTGEFTEPIAPDLVKLPWHPKGNTKTQLKKPSVAVCSWRCEIQHSDIVEFKGMVPPTEMAEIIRRIEVA